MASAAISGKGAILYLGSATAGAAAPVGEQVDWSLDFDMGLVDVTPLNTTWKEFVKAVMGWTGAFNGNFDPTNAALFDASIDTGVEKFYLYPLGAADMTKYYYGTAWVQLGKIAAGSVTAKASNSVKLTGNGALSRK